MRYVLPSCLPVASFTTFRLSPCAFSNLYSFTSYRKPKHDMGSVEGIVQKYLSDRAALMGDTSKNKRS